MTYKKNTFRDAVFQAFKDVKYPTGSILRKPYLLSYQVDDYLFINKTWEELREEHLIYHSQQLYILSDEAFVYFLPAILIDIHDKNINAQDFMYSFLSPFVHDDDINEFSERIRFFTPEQCIVILRFIKSFVKNNVYGDESEAMYRGRETIKYWKDKVKKLRRQNQTK